MMSRISASWGKIRSYISPAANLTAKGLRDGKAMSLRVQHLGLQPVVSQIDGPATPFNCVAVSKEAGQELMRLGIKQDMTCTITEDASTNKSPFNCGLVIIEEDKDYPTKPYQPYIRNSGLYSITEDKDYSTGAVLYDMWSQHGVVRQSLFFKMLRHPIVTIATLRQYLGW